MNFWQKIKNNRSRDKPVNSAQNKLFAYKTPFFNFNRGDYTLQNSEIIYAAVSRISNALSAMPMKLYKGLEPVNKNNRLAYLDRIVSGKPNLNMVSSDFFKTVEAVRCTNGNSYVLKVMTKEYQIERLDIIDPSKVTLVLDTDTNTIWYRIRSESEEFVIHPYYILHFKFISTNGYYGINPVSVLQNTLNYLEDVEKLSVQQLQKGINNAVILEAPGHLSETLKTKMINTFVDTYQKTGKNLLLLESGVTAKNLNLTPVDSRIFEVEKITRSRVAMVYNIPSHLLGDYSDVNFTTMEQQQLEFLQLTMLPIITMYEQVLEQLLTETDISEGYKWKFDMDNFLRGDTLARAEANFKSIRSACRTPNEIRAEDGKPPKEGGDELYISKDLISINLLKEKILKELEDDKA